jgi:hypothetical protein
VHAAPGQTAAFEVWVPRQLLHHEPPRLAEDVLLRASTPSGLIGWWPLPPPVTTPGPAVSAAPAVPSRRARVVACRRARARDRAPTQNPHNAQNPALAPRAAPRGSDATRSREGKGFAADVPAIS